ncbi:uncharacterized protein LOC126843637 [Adelges cooleyi]|uniref:uncharacterized protein LOC126843637 n=1 Tax=Adelges cooleyi TaxID=133065 RepID=UPI00217FDE53|nr:uncharacterized protein LOC126843637 [Adelges cooleyi]
MVSVVPYAPVPQGQALGQVPQSQTYGQVPAAPNVPVPHVQSYGLVPQIRPRPHGVPQSHSSPCSSDESEECVQPHGVRGLLRKLKRGLKGFNCIRPHHHSHCDLHCSSECDVECVPDCATECGPDCAAECGPDCVAECGPDCATEYHSSGSDSHDHGHAGSHDSSHDGSHDDSHDGGQEHHLGLHEHNHGAHEVVDHEAIFIPDTRYNPKLNIREILKPTLKIWVPYDENTADCKNDGNHQDVYWDKECGTLIVDDHTAGHHH